MRTPTLSGTHPNHLLLAALVWLVAGSALLLTTVVPAHTVLLGWAPALWLIGAPLAVLLALEPRLPWQWLVRTRVRRRTERDPIWN